MPSRTVITSEDLSLEGLIQYYESKADARSKMTCGYLKDIVEMNQALNGALGQSKARERLLEMRKHPTRREVELKRIAREQRALAKKEEASVDPKGNNF